MDHPKDEDLILHYYGEGEDALSLEAHLASCEGCREAYAALERDLAAVLEALPVPARGEDYGRRVWQRLSPRLERRRWWEILAPRRLAAFASIAALVVAAFLVGRYAPKPQPAPPETVSEQARLRILLADVGEHLERCQRAVIELVNTNGAVDISTEQAWTEELVAANRLYRRAAEAAGERTMASVLEELERTLVEIANSPPKLTSTDLRELRQRIAEQGILFKLRVFGSQLEAREQASARERARRTS
ncbi:MAG: hypothetical protein DMG07_20400 [Acidobacteria bacterium]|nr:MAG: hypothetical protein DMG07_20400 [Acidobacteriota bacterium]